MAAATCDNGTEHFPDSRVIIEEGVCKLADRSAIAGSIGYRNPFDFPYPSRESGTSIARRCSLWLPKVRPPQWVF